MFSYRNLPPCPDPENYIALKTKKRAFWRRKRGTLTPVKLNKTFKKNVSAMSLSSAAAKRIRVALDPYTQPLQMGAVHIRLTRIIMKQYKESGIISVTALKDIDLQKKQYFNHSWHSIHKCSRAGKEINITISPFYSVVKPLNTLVTDYYFDTILLYGEAGKELSLKSKVQTSTHYSFTMRKPSPSSFRFTLPKPNTPFILFLKLSCLEGNEMALHAQHYGMKAVFCG